MSGVLEMADAELTLQDSWDDDRPPDSERRASVRPSSIRPSWDPPDVDKTVSWASNLGTGVRPILLVEGPTPTHRATIYRLTKTAQDKLAQEWVEQGVVENLTARFAKVRTLGSIIPHEWDLLWNLLTLEKLHTEDPIRTLIDQGHLLTEAFRSIWEARFRLEEGTEVKNFVRVLSRWMTAQPLDTSERQLLGTLGVKHEPKTTIERLDMLFFLASLAKQNELVTNIVFIFDGLERAATLGVSRRRELLKELHDFCLTADRWARLGSPIGFMFGYSNEHKALDSIERSNAKLGSKLRSYLQVV